MMMEVVIVVEMRRRSCTSPSSSDGEMNRVDYVIEYTPLDTLEDIVPKKSPFYSLLGSVNVNPLQVKRGEVVLVHKAERGGECGACFDDQDCLD
mmetsp:Transcript_25798/g.55508  ORF Transcript_25798/g.55508 Transcript_25798/m.55508 type:complete len:94 (+) Transcript_25798:1319-1600(+)